MNPRCASCNLATFSSETLAYDLCEINSATMDLTHQSSAYLLGARTCSKATGLCFGSLFQVPVEFPRFLWRHQSSKKSIHGFMFQIKTWPNTALTQTHPTHPAPRAERSSERPLKWTSDVPHTRHCCKQTTITKSQHVCCKHRYVIICTHLITFVHIQCTSVITIIHTCDRQNQHCKLRRKKSCVDAAILCKGASSACLSLSSKAQACQRSDWKFESSSEKIWHSTG